MSDPGSGPGATAFGNGGARPPGAGEAGDGEPSGTHRRSRWKDALAALVLLTVSTVLALSVAEVAFRIRGSGEPDRWYVTSNASGNAAGISASNAAGDAAGDDAAGQKPPSARPANPGDGPTAAWIETVRYAPTPRLPLRISPARFSARKEAGALRVFLLGDSTIYGYPYGPKGTPAKALEILLRDAMPGRRIEVINGGFLGADSSRVLGLLKEIVAFEPDAVVVYVGHNEFLRYDEAHQRDVHFSFNPRVAEPPAVRAFVALHESALWRWACGTDLGLAVRNGWLARRTGQRTGRSGLVDGALAEATFRNHRENLIDMAQLCRERGVRLVLCTVAANLRSQPPLLRRHDRRAQRSAAAEREIEAAEQDLGNGRTEEALLAALRAEGADPLDAESDWIAARAHLADGRIPQAAAAFETALEKDGLRHRAFARISDTVREVARQERVPLADVRARFERSSPQGLVGEELIVDHVHPTLAGMVLLARGLAEGLAASGVAGVPTSPGAFSLTDDALLGRLDLDRAERRDAILRLALSSAGQSNPKRAASLFLIAATLVEPQEADAAVAPAFYRGVAALLQDDPARARDQLAAARAADPERYGELTRRFAQLRIAERVPLESAAP